MVTLKVLFSATIRWHCRQQTEIHQLTEDYFKYFFFFFSNKNTNEIKSWHLCIMFDSVENCAL